MKPTRYIIACIITLSIMCLLAQQSSQNYRKRESIPIIKQEAILEATSTVDKIGLVKQVGTQVKLDEPDRGKQRGERRIMEATAYWEGSCGKAPDDPLYGITASGEYVQEGFIAAGPELKIGTKVYIPYFDKIFTVMDRGRMITDGHLDVYMEDYASCMEFGRRELEVWVLN